MYNNIDKIVWNNIEKWGKIKDIDKIIEYMKKMKTVDKNNGENV